MQSLQLGNENVCGEHR